MFFEQPKKGITAKDTKTLFASRSPRQPLVCMLSITADPRDATDLGPQEAVSDVGGTVAANYEVIHRADLHFLSCISSADIICASRAACQLIF
jgi:hypothetical protein